MKPLRQNRLSIRVKLIIFVLVLTILTALATLGPTLYFFTRYSNEAAQKQAVQGVEGLYGILEDYKQIALANAVLIAGNVDVVRAVEAKDMAMTLATVSKLARDAKVDFVTITDETGKVIARTHESTKSGDMVNNQENVASALKGTPLAAVEPGNVVKMSARAGAPVKNLQGRIIGVISTGYDVSNEVIVDRAKEKFATDATLFLGDVRVATTIMKDGKRIIGTKLNEQIAENVLVQKQRFFNQADILGMPYFTAYMPIIGADGKVIGVAFAGEKLSEVVQVQQRMIVTIAVITLVILLAVFLAAVVFSGRMTKSLSELAVAVGKVSDGDLTHEVVIKDHDEIGALAGDYNKMVHQLRTLVSQVEELAGIVAASSKELTSSANSSAVVMNEITDSVSKVAVGVESQSRGVASTSSVVENMSSHIAEIAGNANKASALSINANEAAQNGKEELASAIIQMKNIEKTVTDSGKVVAGLAERSAAIGEIVETIAALSGQTNLLALNAAIEAASAGEHGRGFAVVAEEVRKLAEQSRQATQKIAAMIAAVRSDTDQAINAMDKGINEVRRGTGVVDAVGKVFVEIVSLVEQVSQQVSQISTAAQQLAVNSGSIVETVRDIDRVSQNSAKQTQLVSTSIMEQSATMEEMATTSESLLKSAGQLREAVSRFRI